MNVITTKQLCNLSKEMNTLKKEINTVKKKHRETTEKVWNVLYNIDPILFIKTIEKLKDILEDNKKDLIKEVKEEVVK